MGDTPRFFVMCFVMFALVSVASALALPLPVARIASFSWGYEATGLYPPSYNLPATLFLQVAASPRTDTDTITGQGLWELRVFGNTEEDGSGATRFDEQSGFLNDEQRAQSFSLADSLSFAMRVDFDLSGLGCGTEGPFFCVELTAWNQSTTDFQLEGAKIGCRPVGCAFPDESSDVGKYVTFSDLYVDISAQLVPLNEPADLMLVLTAVKGADSIRHLEGTGLWKASIYGSKTSDGSGEERFDERQQILNTAENTDKGLQSTQPLQLTVSTSFVLSGVGCEDFPYFCATLGKGDNPQPDFNMTGPITSCRQITCLYPGETPIPTARFSQMSLSLALPPGYTYEGTTNINLQVALTPSQTPVTPTDTIEGTGLWRLAIFGSKYDNGSSDAGGRFDERPQVLSATEQDMRLSTSDLLMFNATTPFLVGQVGCDDKPYFCAEFTKGYSPLPDFIFEGVINCVQLTCLLDPPLAIARPSQLIWSIDQTGDLTYDQPVAISLDVQVQPGESELIQGSRLWKVLIYGSNSADGSGNDRFDEKSVLTECQQDKPLEPGVDLEFDIDTEFVLTGVGCSSYPYLCVEFAKGDNPAPDFIMYESVVTCSQLECIPPPKPRFIVSGLDLTVKPGKPTAFQAGKAGRDNSLVLVLEVIYDRLQVGEISGRRLWNIALWASNNSDGSGPKIGDTPQTLTSTQAKTSIVLGEDFKLSSVRNQLDLTEVGCHQISYVCIELSQGTSGAEDIYEFLTEPDTYVPKVCLEMGCVEF